MVNKILKSGVFSLFGILVLYYLFWPSKIDPVSWKSPRPVAYAGSYDQNGKLKKIELLPLGSYHGPEDIVVNSNGFIYTAALEGIIKLKPDGKAPELWLETGGRPLGLAFDKDDNLIVADAFRGLLKIEPNKKITILSDEAGGVPIRYADNVDVAKDGKIYFSDASTKFGAKENGGTRWASILDIVEHDCNGRLLVYEPEIGETKTLADKICFANGIAVSEDQKFLLIAETGNYCIKKYWMEGPKNGTIETVIDALPGSPDNITTGTGGRFWIGLSDPRSRLLDALSEYPILRKIIFRTPKRLLPYPPNHGHVIAVDGNGNILENLQDPDETYPKTTGATEIGEYLYIHSLTANALGRLKLSEIETEAVLK